MKRFFLVLSCAASLFSACGPADGNTNTSTSSSSASCCLGVKPNATYYSCPSSDAAQSCFNNGSPGTCTADSSQNSSCNN